MPCDGGLTQRSPQDARGSRATSASFTRRSTVAPRTRSHEVNQNPTSDSNRRSPTREMSMRTDTAGGWGDVFPLLFGDVGVAAQDVLGGLPEPGQESSHLFGPVDEVTGGADSEI